MNSKTKIGIKLADGTFFPILDENALSQQSLELTTVRDSQESVQINLFKKTGENEPEYISSLIVEDISNGNAGDPTINLKIQLDEDKNLSAQAIDEGSGAKQSLKVSLKNIDIDSFDLPDFDLSDSSFDSFTQANSNDVFISSAEDISFDENIEEKSDNILEEKSEKKKKIPLWLIILISVLCITALVFAILLLTKKMPSVDENKIETKEAVITESQNTMDTTTSIPPKEDLDAKRLEEEAKKIEEEKRKKEEQEKKMKEEARIKEQEALKQKAELEAKKKQEKVKQQIKSDNNSADAKSKKKITVNSKGVVRYKVKWGDTLWDISQSFYRTPWLYKKIAKHNKIKNPNRIVAGMYIEIPPK